MNLFPLLASVVLAAAPAPRVSQDIPLKTRQLKITVRSGELVLKPGAPGKLAYEIEWSAGSSWSFLGFESKGPSEKDLAACSADYSAAKGLVIQTPNSVSAKAKIAVPADVAVELEMDAGTLEIGALTKVSARLDAGTIDYDGTALAAGACVDGVTKAGTVHNDRDRDCKTTPVKLRLGAGTLKVK